MRILFIGDVIGDPGRKALFALLPGVQREYSVDVIVANGENAAGGFGITLDTAQEILDSGVNVITSGGHIWDRKEIIPYLDGELPILRPLNYPSGVPGRGHWVRNNLLVANAMGRVFVGTIDCPFRAMDALLDSLDPKPSVIALDFHAEATSEKEALAWYLDGRVSVVVGTHTHVPTADTRILPKGTAYVTDLGKVGPVHSIIGNTPEDVLQRFLYQTPNRLGIPRGPVSFNSVLVDVDESTGKANSIERVDRTVEVHG
ncbi:MAG: metallophosphoesterase [SAR202 cluster bacterium Io17-Chloro-G3]|nr:MAG: metallophosphoesterase [SAR202 cluster bacterium Io17-Chloro-G3]